MARVLVTGGAGYVGSHCVKSLTTVGHQCVVYDSLTQGHRHFVKWGPLIEGDIRDADSLRATFASDNFDAVLHLAALSEVGDSARHPELYRDVNVQGTRVLLATMQEAGVKRLIFSSTCAVYGGPDLMPITERTPCRPVSPYGETKLMCEGLMDEWCQRHGGMSVRLRYFNAAGADPDGEIGEWHEPETHLIPLVLDAASGRRAAIEIFGGDFPTADGTAIRDYVHVQDLAEAHRKALDYLLGGGNTVALNLGTGQGVSVREVVSAARRVTGRTISSQVVARRAGDPPELVADPREARRVIGWHARIPDITEIIADAWRWHQVMEITKAHREDHR